MLIEQILEKSLERLGVYVDFRLSDSIQHVVSEIIGRKLDSNETTCYIHGADERLKIALSSVIGAINEVWRDTSVGSDKIICTIPPAIVKNGHSWPAAIFKFSESLEKIDLPLPEVIKLAERNYKKLSSWTNRLAGRLDSISDPELKFCPTPQNIVHHITDDLVSSVAPSR